MSDFSKPLSIRPQGNPEAVGPIKVDVLNAPLTNALALVTDSNGIGIRSENLITLHVSVILEHSADARRTEGDLQLAEHIEELFLPLPRKTFPETPFGNCAPPVRTPSAEESPVSLG